MRSFRENRIKSQECAKKQTVWACNINFKNLKNLYKKIWTPDTIDSKQCEHFCLLYISVATVQLQESTGFMDISICWLLLWPTTNRLVAQNDVFFSEAMTVGHLENDRTPSTNAMSGKSCAILLLLHYKQHVEHVSIIETNTQISWERRLKKTCARSRRFPGNDMCALLANWIVLVLGFPRALKRNYNYHPAGSCSILAQTPYKIINTLLHLVPSCILIYTSTLTRFAQINCHHFFVLRSAVHNNKLTWWGLYELSTNHLT